MRQVVKWSVRAAFASFGLWASLSAAQAACEPAKLATKYPSLAGRTITIGQDGESTPFSFRDPADFNHLIGLDADTARAVFGCAGVPVTFTLGNWSGLIPAAMAGQIDVMWDTLLYTPERAKRMDFVAYMHSATALLVVHGNPKQVHGLTDLCGLITTAGLGTTQETMLRTAGQACVAAGKKDVEVITAADMTGGMRLVQNGRADVYATNKFVADSMIASNPAPEDGFGVVTNAQIAAGTAKGNSDLIRLMADGLAEIQSNGQLKTIFERYHVDYDLVTKPEILTQ
ncbi:transporter substrate-binding domain-containing protein [Acidisphaera sp. L21]|uniref:transporter substrate-binding domain-containing protein n=1 Tax=Acidisphaera sp. L21 TaxID=1641851 RepID=UPI00131C8367|nr:transporter substrate-binding domain-containing protein [Acidisphaera sp. L21]